MTRTKRPLIAKRPLRGTWTVVPLPREIAARLNRDVLHASAWDDGAGVRVVSLLEREPPQPLPKRARFVAGEPCWHLIVTHNGVRCPRGRADEAVGDFGVTSPCEPMRPHEIERHYWVPVRRDCR